MFCTPLIEAFLSTNAGSVAFARTSYSNEFRYKSPEERQHNICPPTVAGAEAFLQKACLQPGQPQRCFLMQPMPDIKECGIGLKLYFFSLWYFAVVFLLMAFVSVGQLTQNYENNYYGEKNTDLASKLEGSMGGIEGFVHDDTLANCSRMLFAQSSSITHQFILDLDDMFERMQKTKKLEVSFDIGYTMLFLLSIIVYAVWTRKLIEKQRCNHPTLADYSLKFTQLPESRIPKLLHLLESQNIRIHEIVPIRHINKLILHIKYIKQYYKSMFLQMLVDEEKKCSFYDFSTALRKRDELEGRVREEEMAETSHSAIFVFKTRKDRQTAVKLFRKNWLEILAVKVSVQWLKCRRRTEERKENWLREVNVKSVPTPEDIYWENIRKKRWLLRIKLYLLAITIIVVSSGIIFSLKILQNKVKLPSKQDCISQCQNCKCDREFLDICECILLDEHCPRYAEESVRVGTVQVLIGFAIILMNSILPWALGKITSSEKQSSKPRRKLSTMIKIFLALLINTSFVILFVNANFQSFKVNYMLRLEDEGHKDFTRDWYSEVGFSIMVSMLFSIFTPHGLMCLYYAIKKRCLSRMINFFDTQLAYNNWAIGADIDLPLKTAMLLVIIFACFMYAGGIPLMLLICSLAMFSIYAAEKFMLNYHEKPNERSTILHAWFLKILPWAIIIHCMFSIYMYGAELFPRVPPSKYVLDKYGFDAKNSSSAVPNASFSVDDYLERASNDYEDRASDYPGIAFLVIMGVAALLPLVMPRLVRCCRFAQNWKKKVKAALRDENFFGGKSYQITENPNYREVVRTMYEIGPSPDEEASPEAPTPEMQPVFLFRFPDSVEAVKGETVTEQDVTEEDLRQRE